MPRLMAWCPLGRDHRPCRRRAGVPHARGVLPHHEPAATDVVLSDGRVAQVREMVDTDRPGLETLHDEVGDESLRLRFFSVSRVAGHKYVAHLFAPAEQTVCTLVACLSGRIIGVATAERLAADTAEIERGHGVGTLLLEHLAATCRQRGIATFVADVLPENRRMTEVLTDAGYALARHYESGVLRFEMSTELDEHASAATHERNVAALAARRSTTPKEQS